jgi:hypothetical protein
LSGWKTSREVAASVVAALLLYFLPFGPTLYEIVRSDLTDPVIDEDWTDETDDEDDVEWVDVPTGDMSDVPPAPPPPEPPRPPEPPPAPRLHPLPNAIPVEIPPEPSPKPPEEPAVADVEPPADTDVPDDTDDDDTDSPDDTDPQIKKFIDKKRGPKVLRPTKPVTDLGRKPKRPKKPHKPVKPCDPPTDEIAKLEDKHYEIKRTLVDYYTSHPFQFDDLAGVWTHKDKASGEADGFKIGLPRCSVLKQAGFRSGDIVNDVNGRTISTIPQAIGAYFAMSHKETFIVNVTRKGEKLTLTYDIPHRERKHRRKLKTDDDDGEDVADTKPQ